MSLVNFEVQQTCVTPSQLLLALEQVIPSQTITSAIISTSSVAQRQRILPTHVVVVLVIAMSFWSKDSVVSVFKNLIHGLASLRIPDRIRLKTPTSSSITEARQRTGASVMTLLPTLFNVSKCNNQGNFSVTFKLYWNFKGDSPCCISISDSSK